MAERFQVIGAGLAGSSGRLAIGEGPSTETVPADDLGRSPERPLILHVFPSFGIGGIQASMIPVMAALGRRYRQTVVALDGDESCRPRLGRELDVPFLGVRKQRSVLRSAFAIRGTLASLRPDLLVTYNWGAIEWAAVNAAARIAVHVHLEAGFGLEEADRQFRRRIVFRRIALARSESVLVPSQSLRDLALLVWKLSPGKVWHIPNGVDCARFIAPSQPDRQFWNFSADETVVGTVAPLRPEKNLQLLLRAFAAAAARRPSRLAIVGDGIECDNLHTLAERLGVAQRVVFAGHAENVEAAHATLDIFALTSRTEQMPMSLLEAMAAGKPVVAVDVGDVKRTLAPANRRFVVPRDDESAFIAALQQLLDDAALRRELGRANQAHVRATYPREAMVQSYVAAFERALGRTHSVVAGPAEAGLAQTRE